MRAADAKAHVGKRVVVRAGPVCWGSDGTTWLTKISRDGVHLRTKNLNRPPIRLAAVQAIHDFADQSKSLERGD